MVLRLVGFVDFWNVLITIYFWNLYWRTIHYLVRDTAVVLIGRECTISRYGVPADASGAESFEKEFERAAGSLTREVESTWPE